MHRKTSNEISAHARQPWRWHEANLCRVCGADRRVGLMFKYGTRSYACRQCVQTVIPGLDFDQAGRPISVYRG